MQVLEEMPNEISRANHVPKKLGTLLPRSILVPRNRLKYTCWKRCSSSNEDSKRCLSIEKIVIFKINIRKDVCLPDVPLSVCSFQPTEQKQKSKFKRLNSKPVVTKEAAAHCEVMAVNQSNTRIKRMNCRPIVRQKAAWSRA